jgi:hypothetical protein
MNSLADDNKGSYIQQASEHACRVRVGVGETTSTRKKGSVHLGGQGLGRVGMAR